MQFIKPKTAEEWVLWGIGWACAGLLAGGFAVLVGLAK